MKKKYSHQSIQTVLEVNDPSLVHAQRIFLEYTQEVTEADYDLLAKEFEEIFALVKEIGINPNKRLTWMDGKSTSGSRTFSLCVHKKRKMYFEDENAKYIVKGVSKEEMFKWAENIKKIFSSFKD